MKHKANLVVYVFTILVFAILSIRQEHQATQLRVNVYDSCVLRVQNVARTNRLYEGLVAIERDNPYRVTSPSTIRRRIALFQSAMLIPPTCGENPR